MGWDEVGGGEARVEGRGARGRVEGEVGGEEGRVGLDAEGEVGVVLAWGRGGGGEEGGVGFAVWEVGKGGL